MASYRLELIGSLAVADRSVVLDCDTDACAIRAVGFFSFAAPKLELWQDDRLLFRAPTKPTVAPRRALARAHSHDV